MIPPPEHHHLDEEACACWYRVQSRLIAMGNWAPTDALGLVLPASQCASYLRFARQIRALEDVDPDDLRELEMQLEEERLFARKCLVDFLMIAADRVTLAVMNADGLDSDIADLCRLPGPGGAAGNAD